MRELVFKNINEVFKHLAKKMVPFLADRDDFELKFQSELKCPNCGVECSNGLFYRLLSTNNWNLVGEVNKCKSCRDEEIFQIDQTVNKIELREIIAERLFREYFFLPESFKDVGFSDYNETNTITTVAKGVAISFTKEFIANKGNAFNLCFLGNPGTGKTHLCSAIARNVKQKGFTVGFMTLGKLLSIIKETYQKGAVKTETEVLNDIKRLDLLILDDLGSEARGGNENWRLGTIFEIVESRSGKPTIYTSNLTDNNLSDAVGNRVFSRLNNNTRFIDLFTADYRKKLKIN